MDEDMKFIAGLVGAVLLAAFLVVTIVLSAEALRDGRIMEADTCEEAAYIAGGRNVDAHLILCKVRVP